MLPSPLTRALDRYVYATDLLVVVSVPHLNLGAVDGHPINIRGRWPVCHGWLVGDQSRDGVVLNRDPQTGVHELLDRLPQHSRHDATPGQPPRIPFKSALLLPLVQHRLHALQLLDLRRMRDCPDETNGSCHSLGVVPLVQSLPSRQPVHIVNRSCARQCVCRAGLTQQVVHLCRNVSMRKPSSCESM